MKGYEGGVIYCRKIYALSVLVLNDKINAVSNYMDKHLSVASKAAAGWDLCLGGILTWYLMEFV